MVFINQARLEEGRTAPCTVHSTSEVVEVMDKAEGDQGVECCIGKLDRK